MYIVYVDSDLYNGICIFLIFIFNITSQRYLSLKSTNIICNMYCLIYDYMTL